MNALDTVGYFLMAVSLGFVGALIAAGYRLGVGGVAILILGTLGMCSFAYQAKQKELS